MFSHHSFNSLVFKSCCFTVLFNLGITASANLGSSSNINTSLLTANRKIDEKIADFTLCTPDCDRSEFYIGFNRTNSVRLGQKVVSLPITKNRILLNPDLSLSDKLPNTDVKSIDNRDGNFVSSIHKIENLRIGFSEKSELLQVNSLAANTSAEATVKLLWGDTLTVTSKNLKKGTPIKIIVERNMGGFGNPVTENTYYQAISKTYINKNEVATLRYTIAKKAGAGETDLTSGKDKISYIIETKVGQNLTIESFLQVLDGVKGSLTSNQMLNGADSVNYQIRLEKEFLSSACLRSTSKVFISGNC